MEVYEEDYDIISDGNYESPQNYKKAKPSSIFGEQTQLSLNLMPFIVNLDENNSNYDDINNGEIDDDDLSDDDDGGPSKI